jgi:hypothetical protein
LAKGAVIEVRTCETAIAILPHEATPAGLFACRAPKIRGRTAYRL